MFRKVPFGGSAVTGCGGAQQNIAEALDFQRLLCQVPLSVPLALFIASNQRPGT